MLFANHLAYLMEWVGIVGDTSSALRRQKAYRISCVRPFFQVKTSSMLATNVFNSQSALGLSDLRMSTATVDLIFNHT